jgi:hypothetical protein
MMKLEQLQTHAALRGIVPDALVTVVNVQWFGAEALELTYKTADGKDVQRKLQAPDCRWDLVVCDEAHKMSATVFGGETKYTQRYHLGQLLSGLTRHFLLVSATPHNGKEADFHLFMALLDGDCFEGKYRDGVHSAVDRAFEPAR